MEKCKIQEIKINLFEIQINPNMHGSRNRHLKDNREVMSKTNISYHNLIIILRPLDKIKSGVCPLQWVGHMLSQDKIAHNNRVLWHCCRWSYPYEY